MAVTNKLSVYNSTTSKWTNLDYTNTTDNGKVLTVNNTSAPFIGFSTAAAGTVTSISASAPLETTGGLPITSTGTISLADSGATAGTYTYPKITVTAKGLISSVSNGIDDYIKIGTVTLSGSTATVTDVLITTNSRVLMSYTGSVNAATVGVLYAVMSAGSCTINSNQDGDNNSVYYRLEY